MDYEPAESGLSDPRRVIKTSFQAADKIVLTSKETACPAGVREAGVRHSEQPLHFPAGFSEVQLHVTCYVFGCLLLAVAFCRPSCDAQKKVWVRAYETSARK